jgi:hypothetical protein
MAEDEERHKGSLAPPKKEKKSFDFTVHMSVYPSEIIFFNVSVMPHGGVEQWPLRPAFALRDQGSKSIRTPFV